MRLITCSNSAPQIDVTTGEMVTTPGTPGGLLPIMMSLLGEVGGRWIVTSPTGAAQDPIVNGDMAVTPLAIGDELASAHYGKISISTFLWLFHYVFDTTYEPSFSSAAHTHWSGYEEVNRRFAEQMLLAHEDSAEQVMLVHDFHLMLVPGMIHERLPDRRSRLVYFHHVPWCEPDYFALLPTWMRTPVLESLLASDVVGFHSQRWADAFASCCDRFLGAAKVTATSVEYRGRRTSLAVAPGPIDADVLQTLQADPLTEQWRDCLTQQAAGRRPIVRVDRLDLWKNVVRGFEAFELLLEREPALASELWFCGIVSPPRRPTGRSIAYRTLCEATANRINERFGGAGRDPVSLIYPEGRHSRHRAVAALELSSVTLVNPTLDGLNMVSKEAMVVGSAPLLLSVNAGAYEQLQDGVIPIHPYDVEATADAMVAALDGDRVAGSAHVAGRLRQETAAAWLQRLLADHPAD